jgi:hypothetical protein
MKKKVVILISSLLVIGALLSGCTQGLYSISVLPQNIGDEVTYTVSFTTSTTSTGSYPSEPSTQSTTMNGTIFSKVNGTKTVKDGFGVEKEAVEMYTKTSFDMNSTTQQMPYEYEVSTVTYSYIDLASKVPIKTTTQMDMGLMKMLYEFYVSENMYKSLYSSFSSLGMIGSSMAGPSPNDISSAFEGKTIQKGDTGTITIMNMTITWTAVDNENVKGYDCVKIQFDFPMPISSGNISTTVDFTYTIWLADSFPNLIKMSGTITSETTTTFLDTENTYQSSTVINMILDSSKRGQTEIVWGSAEPSFPEANLFGDYTEWEIAPPSGDKDTTISYGPQDALLEGAFLSLDLSSYLDSHPDAYVINAKYERKNTTETWELTFADDTIDGYKIKLTHNGTTTTIISEESTEFSTTPSPKALLPKELLTFSGCEYILSQYTSINSSSDMQIQFIADISHQSSTSGSGSVFTSDISEMFPHSLYMIMVGDTQQGATMAIIDAETGQLIMIYIMEGFSFGL